MRKKVLITKISELVDTVNSLQRKLDDMLRENTELKEKVKELSAKQKEEIMPQPQVLKQEDSEQSATVTETESTEESLTGEQTETNTFEPDLSEWVQYGAVAIGTIVQESVKYSGKLSSAEGESKKELLSLIMGRAEVAKAEIFSITESDNSLEVKKELIDGVVSETVDYFKSVAAQI